MLATSGNEIKIWEIENFNLVNEYKFQKSINWFCVKPDNSGIASVVNNESINLINLQTQEINTYKDIEAKCCCYESFGKYLSIGLLNGNVDIYDLKSSNFRKKTHKVHTSSINCISWSKNDRYIASGAINGNIMLLNAITNQVSKPLYVANKSSSVTSLQYSVFNISSLAASYDDGTIIYWDTTKEKPLCVFNKHEAPATCCILSPINEMLMISGGLDNVLACYDIRAKKHIKSVSISGGITSLDMHIDGSTLAIGTANGNVQIHDLRSKFDDPFYSYQAHYTPLHCLKFLYQQQPAKTTKTDDLTSNIKKSNSLTENLTNGTNSTGETTNSRILIQKTNNVLNNNKTNTTIPNFNETTKESSQFSFNIYSPECVRTESTQLSQQNTTTTTLNKQQLTSTSSSSFILHKNPTNNNNIDNLTPIVSNNTISNPVTPTIPTNNNLNVNKVNLLISNKNINNLKAELYSPVVPNISIASTTNNNQTSMNNNSPNYDKSITNQTTDVSEVKVNLKVPNLVASTSNGQSTSNDKNNLNVTPLRPTTLTTTNSLKETLANNSAINISRVLNTNASATLGLNNSLLNHNDSTIAGINAHATTLPMEQIKEIIKDSIDELRDEFMNENFKFKAEILKEFMHIKQEIHDSFKLCSVNEALVAEIARLREENKRLKKLF